jgi:2-C-methyl-D-erythritol 4-phosphate cytidylyltransferase
VKCIDAGGAVVETLDRSTLRLIQTPQLFRAASLRHAHAYARERGIRATDDAALVEQAGMTVCTFPGDARSFKITYPSDLDLARCLLHGAGCT